MKKILLIIVAIASISVSCNKVNLSQDEAKALIVQSLHLPFIFRFDINKRASFDNDFALYGLFKAGLVTNGDYYPGQTINTQPTELGRSSYLGDSGNAYMFKTNDIVFVQVTGISVNKDQQTATIRFTLKADNVTLAGYALAKAQGNLNGDKCIVYSLKRPLNGELTYKKFDNGWQLATDENKSSLDLLNQILDTNENSNRQDDYSNEVNTLTAQFQAKQGKENLSRQGDSSVGKADTAMAKMKTDNVTTTSKNYYVNGTFTGAWFKVTVPSDFIAKPSMKSKSGNGYESAFFDSPDGDVEFYIFSPQWGGEPTDIRVDQNTEKVTSKTSQNSKDKITTWSEIQALDGSYLRAYQDTKSSNGSVHWVIGLKYKSKTAYDKYKQAYLSFKKSLTQFSD